MVLQEFAGKNVMLGLEIEWSSKTLTEPIFHFRFCSTVKAHFLKSAQKLIFLYFPNTVQ